MMCRKQWSRHLCALVMMVGAVSLLFGLLTFLIAKPQGHQINTLLGMFTGFGACVLGVAAWKTIRARVIPREKLEREEIEREDERNVAIIRAACTAAYYAALALLGVLTFVFMGLGYSVPAYFCLGGMYVLVAVFFISKKILTNRM